MENQITVVSSKMFKGLSRLKDLNLWGNTLKYVAEQHPFAVLFPLVITRAKLFSAEPYGFNFGGLNR